MIKKSPDKGMGFSFNLPPLLEASNDDSYGEHY